MITVCSSDTKPEILLLYKQLAVFMKKILLPVLRTVSLP